MLDANRILKLVQDELENAQSVSDEGESARALDYFNCELPAPMTAQAEEQTEWSRVVSPDVKNAVIATLAEVLPGFTGDMPAQFQPLGAEDEKQAADESRIVTHVIFTGCRGYEKVMRAVQDALLFGAGVLQAYWEDKVSITGARLEGVPADQLQMMMQQGAEASLVEQGEDGSFTVDLVHRLTTSKPAIDWVPAAELRVAEGHRLADLDDARLVARMRQVTASDLVAVGIPKETVDRLQASGNDDSEDLSQRLITINECYVRIDVDEDGIAELRRVVLGGGADGDDEVLDDRPWDTQPFALGVPYLSPETWIGIGLFERLAYIQDINTALQRQILDAGWRNLVQRVGAVERLYNHADLVASQRGGIVRLKEPGALVPLPDVQLSPLSLQLLELTDKMRRESGGGAIDTAPQAQQFGNDTAHGLERLMTALEQTNQMVAKNMAETLMVALYVKVHALLRKHWQGVIQARSQGSWLSQVPDQWGERTDVAVAVGLSTSERNAQGAAIASVIAQQQQALQAGQDGVLVGLPQIHNALVDYGRMIGLNAPEQYWVDPASPEGQQAAQQKAQAAQQQQEAAAKAAQAQVDAMLEVENIRAESKQYSDNLDHVKAVNDSLVQLLEISGKYTEAELADFAGVQDKLSANDQAQASAAREDSNREMDRVAAMAQEQPQQQQPGA